MALLAQEGRACREGGEGQRGEVGRNESILAPHGRYGSTSQGRQHTSHPITFPTIRRGCCTDGTLQHACSRTAGQLQLPRLTHGAPDGEDEVGEETGEEDGVAKGAVLDGRVVQPRVPAGCKGSGWVSERSGEQLAGGTWQPRLAPFRRPAPSMGGATNPVTPAMCFAQPGAPHSQQAAHQRMYAPGTPPTNQMALHSQADT